jgi:hypothetical protein
MLKRMLAVGLVVGLAALTLASCGGKNSTSSASVGNGALYTFIGDTPPASDVLSLRATVNSITLTQQGTTNEVGALASSSAYIKLDFTSLRDFATVLALSQVPELTYDKVTISLSSAQITLYDPTQSPPVRVLYADMSPSAPVIPIRPALTVTEDEVAALQLDFDLLRSVSIEEDADGKLSATLTPVMKASPVAPVAGQGYGQFDDLVGFVRSVTPYPVGGYFNGAFSLQLLAGTGPAISVYFTDSTQLYGVPALNQLEPGRVVEVDAVVDEKGNLVGKTVEVEDRAVVAESKLAFLGYVISVTKDDTGNVTQFSLYVREEEPDASGDVPLDSVVVVKVSSTTTFQYSSRATDFASLPFDATAVAPGQELIVHGKYTNMAEQPTTVDANSIFLKLQTVQGTLYSLLRVESDGKTGAFQFAPAATLLQGAPILVFTNNETVFVNVFGLAELTPQSTLFVKGLPFYQRQAGTINGVTVPAGTLVITAGQVHQLQ